MEKEYGVVYAVKQVGRLIKNIAWILQKPKKVMVIWNNASWHRSGGSERVFKYRIGKEALGGQLTTLLA